MFQAEKYLRAADSSFSATIGLGVNESLPTPGIDSRTFF